MSARRFLSLFLIAAFVVSEAGCSPGKNSTSTAPDRVGTVTTLYEMSKAKLGHAPSDEAEFKKAVESEPVKLEKFKVTSFDELLVSARDGQPLTVVYGPAASNANILVSEQTGVNGKRMVGLRTGMVEEVDEARYKELMGSKH